MLTQTFGPFTRTISPPTCPPDCPVRLPGFAKGNAAYFGLDDSLLRRSVLLLGAARSGKSYTESKLIAQIKPRLRPQDAMVILDTKGEYQEQFYAPGDLVVGSGGPSVGTFIGWNLFLDCIKGCQSDEEVIQRIGMMADRIFYKENTQTPYFTDAPRRVFEELVFTLLCHKDLIPAPHVLDNAGLLAFLQRGDWKAFLRCCSAPEEMTAYIGTGSRSQQTPTERSVLAELYINLTNQLHGVWAGHGGFSMMGFEKDRKGQTLFLQYDPKDGGASKQVYRLLLDLLLVGLMDGKNRNGRLYLFLDEIALLGESPEMLIEAINYGPGVGLGGIVVGCQSLAQLYQMCGKDGANTLLAGLQTRIMFHTEDEISRNFVKEQCATAETTTITYIPGISFQPVAGKTENAITDEELNRMGLGDAIIKQPSYPAFTFHFT